MEIREAKIEDVDDILNLNQKLFDYEFANFDDTLDCSWSPKNRDYFENAVKNKNSIALVAISDGKIIGYLIGSIHKTEDYRKLKEIVEVDNTFVDEEHRNKGVGKKLFEKFLEWAKNKGMNRMKVVASSKNKGARGFYKKCGFNDYNFTLEAEINDT